jgi:hypothetical protein
MELVSGRSGTVQASHIVQLQVNGVESSHPIKPNVTPVNTENPKEKKKRRVAVESYLKYIMKGDQ